MKNIIIYSLTALIITAAVFINGCDSPAPTELVQNSSSGQNPIQVQVITKDTANAYYNNGFDTTGVSVSDTGYSTVINVSGTKVTRNLFTTKISFAQALFFDESNPFRLQSGKLIGYHTITPGDVQFDNHSAKLFPYRLGYTYLGHQVDTLLGERYIASSSLLNPLYQFNFKFNSSVNFQLVTQMGMSVSFNIPTPPEIFGKVKLTGKSENNTLAAELDWNTAYQKKIDIIVGAIPRNLKNPIPLFQIKADDSGSLIIPAKLINAIPISRYNKVVFTFVRNIEIHKSLNGNKLLILSQSIHSIILDIP